MDILIALLFIAICLVAIALIVALFVKKEYAIRREVVIKRPKTEVFNYIRFLKNQLNYSKWVMADPNMKKEFSGTDGTVGFIFAWDGNKEAGEGEQEITAIKEGERLDVEVRFVRPFESVARTPLTTERLSERETKVTWGMLGKNKYPLNLMNLFMDNMLGKDLDTSLMALKNILEKK